MTAKVLVLDDSLTVRMDLADILTAEGFHVTPCASIADAKAVLARESIALAILDVLLPDGDGIGLLESIRNTPPTATLPVLLLSTEAEVRDRIRGLRTGADDFVGKPYDAGYVVARARELMAHAEGRTAGDDRQVLVIDDSATFREELRATLEASGYTVAIAASGEEGLRVAAAVRPAAIIVDGVMRGIDGATVIRRLRLDAALRGTPCLLLTASDDDGAELRALDAGADAFARKEGDLDVIVVRLAALLRSSAGDAGHATSALGPKRILAVDDSPTYLNELASVLRGDGYDVVLARSGEEAIEMIAAQAIDCVLLDVIMPGLGGHETCRHLKASPVTRDVPLIMLTALENRDAMIGGLSTGADDFMSKSGDFEVLKARVRAQLRRKQFEDEHRRIREELLRSAHEAAEERAAREHAETRVALVEALEQRNRELEAFSYSVSHDLRTPLRAIDGFSAILLRENADRLDDAGKGYLGRIRSASQRMSELIDDLLTLARISRSDLERRPVDLADVARTVAADLAAKDPQRDVEISIEAPIAAEADRRLMRVVFENLLGNAWKFTAKTAAARVEVGVDREAEPVTYFVRDNGAGFDMAYASRLFGAFQRLHSEREFSGTGIGLATCHRIIERHGGRIWAQAAVGAGATISFTLGRERAGSRRS